MQDNDSVMPSIHVWIPVFVHLSCLSLHIKLGYCAKCPASVDTKVYVASCPTNKTEWDVASRRKNCSAVKQDCTPAENFLYHCLANSYQDVLIEVCSEPVIISFPVCVEYNEGENIVQENHFTDCSAYDPRCPNRYSSTDAFKYPGCYNITQRTTTVTTLPEKTSTDRPFCSHEISTIPIVHTTKTTEFSTTYYLEHTQLVLACIVVLAIALPVVPIIVIVQRYSSVKDKQDNFYTPLQLGDQDMELTRAVQDDAKQKIKTI